MPTVNEINDYFAKKVPHAMKWEFDNVGFLAGNGGAEVKTALIALDITNAVIGEAIALKARLVMSHHPLIREGLKNVTTNTSVGAKVVRLLENKISAICLHTNLDCASDGTSDALAKALGLEVAGFLEEAKTLDGYGEYGLGKIAYTKTALTMPRFLSQIKTALRANGLRYVDSGRPVSRVAVCGGSGGDYIKRAFDIGCDTYVTADLKHGMFIEAAELGINLIDAGHHSTEAVVVPRIAEMLRAGFPDIDVILSQECRQPEEYFG